MADPPMKANSNSCLDDMVQMQMNQLSSSNGPWDHYPVTASATATATTFQGSDGQVAVQGPSSPPLLAPQTHLVEGAFASTASMPSSVVPARLVDVAVADSSLVDPWMTMAMTTTRTPSTTATATTTTTLALGPPPPSQLDLITRDWGNSNNHDLEQPLLLLVEGAGSNTMNHALTATATTTTAATATATDLLLFHPPEDENAIDAGATSQSLWFLPLGDRMHPWLLLSSSSPKRAAITVAAVAVLLVGGVELTGLLDHHSVFHRYRRHHHNIHPHPPDPRRQAALHCALQLSLQQQQQQELQQQQQQSNNQHHAPTATTMLTTVAWQDDPKSAQSVAVDWMASGQPGEHVSLEHCATWNSPFALAFAVIVIRQALHVPDAKWHALTHVLDPLQDFCHWPRIQCHNVTNHDDKNTTRKAINSLTLGNADLDGTLPAELFMALSDLELLELHSNPTLWGTIPYQIQHVTLLTSLQAQETALSGTITTEMGKLVALQHLFLQDTQLTGSVPDQICDLKKHGSLEDIHVSSTVQCRCC